MATIQGASLDGIGTRAFIDAASSSTAFIRRLSTPKMS
jgi:hypothetical protein